LGITPDATLALRMIAAQNGASVAQNLDMFTGLTADVAREIARTGSRASLRLAIEHRDRFEGLTDEVLLEMCRDAKAIDALTHEQVIQFGVQAEYVENMEQRLITGSLSSPYNDTAQLTAYLTRLDSLPFPERPQATTIMQRDFPKVASLQVLKLIRDVQGGVTSPDAQELGVTQGGEEGLRQLREGLQSLANEMTQIDGISVDSMKKYLKYPVLRSILASYTRYDMAQWSTHDDGTLRDMIQYRIDVEKDGILVPMPEEYRPSAVVEIGLLKRMREKVTWTVDTLERYTILRREIHDASRRRRGGMGKLVDELRDEVRTLVQSLDDRLADETLKDKARASITQRRDTLLELITPPDPDQPERYPLRSLQEFQQNFTTLAVSKELHPRMRMIMFAWALRRNPDWAANHKDVLSIEAAQNPDVDDIADVRQFIETIVNQETFDQYFTDQKAGDAFRNMVNTKALEAGLLRHQGVGVGKRTLAMQFVPTRGLLLEFSGQIGDACWSNKYASIAEKMPNTTAVIMKQRPGTPNERLAGSALLIETKDTRSRRPLLVIRGLNPLENVINHVSAPQFFDEFVNWARVIARERGRDLAIVIDDHSGGSGTNRPVLHSHMYDVVRRGLNKAHPKESDTTFNSYNVTDNTYLL